MLRVQITMNLIESFKEAREAVLDAHSKGLELEGYLDEFQECWYALLDEYADAELEQMGLNNRLPDHIFN